MVRLALGTNLLKTRNITGRRDVNYNGCWFMGTITLFRLSWSILSKKYGKEKLNHLPTASDFHQKPLRCSSKYKSLRSNALLRTCDPTVLLLRNQLSPFELHSRICLRQKIWVLGYLSWRDWRRLPYYSKSFLENRWRNVGNSNLCSFQSSKHQNWWRILGWCKGQVLARWKACWRSCWFRLQP
jgi:hypothetical protein